MPTTNQTETASTNSAAPEPAPHLLSDVKVLDFTRNLAGPTATRMLVEMGADVVKVEQAPRGDRSRGASAKMAHSAMYAQQNRGKQSVCVDFRSAEGVGLIERLIQDVDVVIESYRPGVFADMGFGYERLKALKPDIVLCSLSALGQTGPLAQRPGYDYIAQGYSGVTSMIGQPEDTPVIPGVGLGDVSTGVHAALGILAALHYRDRTGQGQAIDISLLDTYYHFHELNLSQHFLSDGKRSPTRNGSHMTYLSPAGVFHARGGDVVIMGHAQHWPDLCKAMDRHDLLSDQRFNGDGRRLKNRAELTQIIEAWLAEFPDRDAAVEHLAAYDVPVGPVLSVAETLTHPHLVARNTVRNIDDEVHGTFPAPNMPIRFSEFPTPRALHCARLGEHNRSVLCERLGISEGELQQLIDDGVLAEQPA